MGFVVSWKLYLKEKEKKKCVCVGGGGGIKRECLKRNRTEFLMLTSLMPYRLAKPAHLTIRNCALSGIYYNFYVQFTMRGVSQCKGAPRDCPAITMEEKENSRGVLPPHRREINYFSCLWIKGATRPEEYTHSTRALCLVQAYIQRGGCEAAYAWVVCGAIEISIYYCYCYYYYNYKSCHDVKSSSLHYAQNQRYF